MKTKNQMMATCVPGAEQILAEEISESLHTSAAVERGKAFFTSNAEPHAPPLLMCADNIYKVLNRFRIGPHKDDLRGLYYNILQTGLDSQSKSKPKIVVSASRSGRHTYSRQDVSDTAANAMISTGKFARGDKTDHDIAFRIDVKDDSCIFSMQLTSPSFRFRGTGFCFAQGGIRPTVAHCLVRVSGPKPGDIFYDPFCGGGTIPLERAAFNHRKILASDISDTALNSAAINLNGRAVVFKADAANTGMKTGSIDAVVTNMPWGAQIRVPDIEMLYRGFARELKRILKPNGRAVILTDQDELFYDACAECRFDAIKKTELSLHGRHPSVYLLTVCKE